MLTKGMVFQNVRVLPALTTEGILTSPEVTLASPSCLRRGLQSPRVSLVSIDLYYVWRTVPGLPQHKQSKIDIALLRDRPHPFASQLLLPVEYVLDSALEKFVSLHLVRFVPHLFFRNCHSILLRCYPLIFGSLGRASVLSFGLAYLTQHYRNWTWKLRSSRPSLAPYLA
jgi:hypothetical protein